ncbi:MAG: hypothetical protein RIT81_36390 [Deltaproteobacteria bacterium]
MSKLNLDRRNFLRGMGYVAAGTALGLPGRAGAQARPEDARFLVVLTASGGASLIDSFLSIRASESANASTINTYEDNRVQSIADSPFRAIDSQGSDLGALPAPYTANQSNFVRKHKDDMMVVTCTGTSVNHAVAQKRAITGNEAWAGRTLQEVNAMQYGESFLLPNVVMATGTAYIDPGTDGSLPSYCSGEPVAQPALWPLSLHGTRGVKGPNADFVKMARRVRDEQLDPRSKFARVFDKSPALSRWRQQRLATQGLETSDLITKLMLFEDSERYPLSAHGLTESSSGRLVRERFPNFDQDPLEAQAALAFLLLKNRVSVSVTLGTSFNAVLADGASLGGGGLQEGDLINPPIGFDFSHQAHRATQAMMWSRVLAAADGLIELLKAEEFADGQSFWDRTLLYVATDFGRDKVRPSGSEDFGTSHHLNNGFLLVSPLVNGNTVLGGVDPDTGLTYGFDPVTGAPAPGTEMAEAQIYAGIAGALGVDTTGSGLPNVPAMSRS